MWRTVMQSTLGSCVILGAALVIANPATAAPVVRADGTQLKLGTRRFHVYGFNYDFNNVHPNLDYFEAPTRAGRLRVRADFAEAARLGANTMRVYVELHEVMATATRTRARGLRTLRNLLDEAERAGLLLDITGNLVWHIRHSPRWYEQLSEHGRWRVQERFWRAVARVGARSPNVLCYELTSEPAIGDSDYWYTGLLVHHYVQYIARTVQGREPVVVVRNWTRRLRDAILSEDRRHMVTIGLLPTRGWAFDPRYVADLLDLVTVHDYPAAGTQDEARSLVRYFASQGKPLLLGETFAVDRVTQEAFLVSSRRWLDGTLSFYDGRAPEDVPARPSLVDAMYLQNLVSYLGLRTTLRASDLR